MECAKIVFFVTDGNSRTGSDIACVQPSKYTSWTFVTCLFPNHVVGWWLVESEGELGWAPALYLEPADEMADVSNAQTFSVGRGKRVFLNDAASSEIEVRVTKCWDLM